MLCYGFYLVQSGFIGNGEVINLQHTATSPIIPMLTGDVSFCLSAAISLLLCMYCVVTSKDNLAAISSTLTEEHFLSVNTLKNLPNLLQVFGDVVGRLTGPLYGDRSEK